MSEFRYRAFISYSHRDETWGRWLQKALERYRIPRHLAGQTGQHGKIPARLAPIFRDREDLPSGSDLNSQVREELEHSETLVVICSPAAAASRWVNEEIRQFIALGRGDRIYAMIVDGDPLASDPAERCFPPALLFNTDGSEREPLAADVRKWADGKLLAKLKLISGILGIRLDDLRRRDMQRRHRVMMASMGGAVVIAVIMTVLAISAITARNAAENRREHAENLVGYMVGDLKSKLDEVGRLDILEGVGGRVGEYLQTLDPSEVTDESLNQQAQVWRQLGEVSMEQGELNEAFKAFNYSRDILAELHRRKPDQPEYIYELGNAEFWVGYVYLEQGEFESTRESFEAYLEYADMLVELEPENPDWLMEKSYAHSNLAALIARRAHADVQPALLHIKAAVDINRKALELDPDNPDYRSEYSSALAWQADTQLLACDLGGALISRQETAKIARSQMEQDQGNVNYQSRYAYSLTGLASVAAQVGLVDTAIDNYEQARELLSRLFMIEQSNIDYEFETLIRESDIADLMAESGNLDAALGKMERIQAPLRAVLESESYENVRRHTYWIAHLVSYSEMLWRAGRVEQARAVRSEAFTQIKNLLESESSPDAFWNQLLSARFVYWQQEGRDILDTWEISDVTVETVGTSCLTRSMLALQAIMSGNRARAEELTEQLLRQGYYEPRFVRICRQYQLCPQGS